MMNRLTTLLLTIAVLIGSAGVTHGLTCSDPNLGYSFDLPDDWVQIPQDAVDTMVATLTAGRSNSNFRFVAAYQPKANKFNFQYPYLMVQVTTYNNDGRVVQTVSEADLKKMTQQMSGLKQEDINKVTGWAVKLITSDFHPGEATYFTQPPGYQFNLVESVLFVGKIQGVCRGILGKQNCVSINLYARQSDWGTFAPAFQQTLSSFRLDPDKQVALAPGFAQIAYPALAAVVCAIVAVWWTRNKKAA